MQQLPHRTALDRLRLEHAYALGSVHRQFSGRPRPRSPLPHFAHRQSLYALQGRLLPRRAFRHAQRCRGSLQLLHEPRADLIREKRLDSVFAEPHVRTAGLSGKIRQLKSNGACFSISPILGLRESESTRVAPCRADRRITHEKENPAVCSKTSRDPSPAHHLWLAIAFAAGPALTASSASAQPLAANQTHGFGNGRMVTFTDLQN